MTFENEEGKVRADAYMDTARDIPQYKHYNKLLDGYIDLKQAVEPSDIIWENRNMTSSARLKRAFIIFIVIGSILVMSFVLIFWISRHVSRLAEKYPMQNCPLMEKNYADKER